MHTFLGKSSMYIKIFRQGRVQVTSVLCLNFSHRNCLNCTT